MLLHSLIFLPQLASNTCSPHVFFRKGRKWARLSNFVVLFFSQPISLSLPSASLTILNKKKHSHKGNLLRELPSPFSSHLFFCLMQWLFTQVFIIPKLLEKKVKWRNRNITWCQKARDTREPLCITPLRQSLPCALSTLNIVPLTDNDDGICV